MRQWFKQAIELNAKEINGTESEEEEEAIEVEGKQGSRRKKTTANHERDTRKYIAKIWQKQ